MLTFVYKDTKPHRGEGKTLLLVYRPLDRERVLPAVLEQVARVCDGKLLCASTEEMADACREAVPDLVLLALFDDTLADADATGAVCAFAEREGYPLLSLLCEDGLALSYLACEPLRTTPPFSLTKTPRSVLREAMYDQLYAPAYTPPATVKYLVGLFPDDPEPRTETGAEQNYEKVFLYGAARFHGVGFEKHISLGLACMGVAAEHGERQALRELVRIYRTGDGIDEKNLGSAEELARANLTLCRRQTGDLSAETAQALNDLAWVHRDKEDERAALFFYVQALIVYVHLYGFENAQSVDVLYSIFNMHEKHEENHASLTYGKRLLALQEKVSGKEASDTVSVMGRVAIIHSALGEYEEALTLQKRALDIRLRLKGEENPDTLVSLSNLAYLYSAVGRNAEALPIEERLVEIKRRLFGEKNPSTLVTQNNLAYTLCELGEYERALAIHERVYEIRMQLLGEENRDTLVTMNNIALVYDGMGRKKEALALHEKTARLRAELLGEAHPATLLSRAYAAALIGELGDPERAIALLSEILPLRASVSGETHVMTLRARQALGENYLRTGAYAEATDAFSTVYEIRREQLGEDAADTKAVKALLERARAAQENGG